MDLIRSQLSHEAQLTMQVPFLYMTIYTMDAFFV